MLPSSSRRRYSGAGRPADRQDQVLAGEGGGQAEPVLEGAGHRRDRDPGAAFLGGGEQGGLVDETQGPTVAGHGDDAAGLRLLGAAYGLSQRQVVGDGERAARELAGDQARQPPSQPGGRHGRGGPGPQEHRDHEGQDEVEQLGLGCRGAGSWSIGQQSTATAVSRPPQPATMVPRWTLPVSAPHGGLEDPAAVERQPGHEVEQADQEVGAGQGLDRHPQQPVGRDELEGERRRHRPRSR